MMAAFGGYYLPLSNDTLNFNNNINNEIHDSLNDIDKVKDASNKGEGPLLRRLGPQGRRHRQQQGRCNRPHSPHRRSPPE